MKKISFKKMLATVGLLSVSVPSALSVVACGPNDTAPREVKFNFTSLEKQGSLISLSSTTGVFKDSENSLFFFDSTKINQKSKGFVDLEIKTSTLTKEFFIRMSDTVGILIIDDQANMMPMFFFDSEKVNEENKGIINLEKKAFQFVRLSDTIGIFVDSAHSKRAFIFDSEKVNEENKGMVRFYDLPKNLGFAYNLSATTGIMTTSAGVETYFVDASKIEDEEIDFVELGLVINSFYRLSDTLGIMEENKTQEMFLFDSTKVSEESKGLIKLDRTMKTFYSLSSTAGILKDESDQAYLFDSAKVSEESKGLIKLDRTMQDFYSLSSTTGIFNDNGGNAFFFDSTKINQESKAFVDLNKEMQDFYSLSSTTGILKDKSNQTFLFEVQ